MASSVTFQGSARLRCEKKNKERRTRFQHTSHTHSRLSKLRVSKVPRIPKKLCMMLVPDEDDAKDELGGSTTHSR